MSSFVQSYIYIARLHLLCYGQCRCMYNSSLNRSMRRARDVREQIEGLMTRVEIEITSNPIDDVAIRKV